QAARRLRRQKIPPPATHLVPAVPSQDIPASLLQALTQAPDPLGSMDPGRTGAVLQEPAFADVGEGHQRYGAEADEGTGQDCQQQVLVAVAAQRAANLFPEDLFGVCNAHARISPLMSGVGCPRRKDPLVIDLGSRSILHPAGARRASYRRPAAATGRGSPA